MSNDDKAKYSIRYPRLRIRRGIARFFGRLALPLAFNLKICGKENYPKIGPLIVVGNHVAVMESVMMTICTPWQVEMLGSVDVPHEKLTDVMTRFFGYIPVYRGKMEISVMQNALDVLKQNGVLGIFPEGGIWDASAMQARSGVSWLSYRSKAPILPIGFGGTLGALGEAFRLKRPRISMNIGKLIPAANIPRDRPRKLYFQEFANRVMEAVNNLIPEDELHSGPQITDERFELKLAHETSENEQVDVPDDLQIQHDQDLAKFLHRPGILKIFWSNLEMPIDPLRNLASVHDPKAIADSTRLVIDYLETGNPYLLTYRFGPKQGANMKAGLEELLHLAEYSQKNGFFLHVTPIRRYYRDDFDGEIVETDQGSFEDWM